MLNGVYYIKNPDDEMIPVVHISKFASLVGLTLPTARNLRDRVKGEWDKRRKLKTFNDGSTIWVPITEVTGYPFYKGSNVYHYDMQGNRYFCEKCSFDIVACDKALEAEEVKLPEDI